MSVDPITCHILDTTVGKPASGVTCQIFRISDLITSPGEEASYEITQLIPFGVAKTDKDGRIKNWSVNQGLHLELKVWVKKEIGLGVNGWSKLVPGIYKVKFFTGKYLHDLAGDDASLAQRTFFPFVEITFQVNDPADAHYHIPLLLSNHSYTTYRGS